jgi:hypothetical protein
MSNERAPLLAEHAAQRDHGAIRPIAGLGTVGSYENGHGHGDIETSTNGTPGAEREGEADDTPAPSTLFLMSMVSHSYVHVRCILQSSGIANVNRNLPRCHGPDHNRVVWVLHHAL